MEVNWDWRNRMGKCDFYICYCWCSDKESDCQCRRWKRRGFYPLVRKKPWSRKWQPSSVFLLGTFHGERSLAGSCPWGQKESDMTEWLSTHKHIHYSLCACVLHCFSGARLFADPIDCSPPGSSVRGILQERILERVDMPSSQGSLWARDRTCLSCDSCTAGWFFTAGPLGKTTMFFIGYYTPYKNLWMTPKSRWENENEKANESFRGRILTIKIPKIADKPCIGITI